jgi:hypothetical protein
MVIFFGFMGASPTRSCNKLICGIHFCFGAVGNGGGDIFVKSGKHRYVAASAAPCARIGLTEFRTIANGTMPRDCISHGIHGRRHAASWRCRTKDPADIGRPAPRGPAEDTLDAVEDQPAGGKSVVSHQRKPAYGQAHAACLP